MSCYLRKILSENPEENFMADNPAVTNESPSDSAPRADTADQENSSLPESNETENESGLPPPGRVRTIISKFETTSEGVTSPVACNGGLKISRIEPPSIIAENGLVDLPSMQSLEPDKATGFVEWFSIKRKKSSLSKPKRNSSFYSDTDETFTSDFVVVRSPSSEICSVEKDYGLRPDSVNSFNYAPFDSDNDSLQNVEALVLNTDTVTRKAFLVAQEIVTSEKEFITSLRLMNVVFRNFMEKLNHESRIIPPEDLRKLLIHLPELQALNEDLYKDLKERLQNWECNPKIADVIVKKGDFLKIYVTYFESFTVRSQFLDECCAKYIQFGKFLKQFESGEQCRKLTLQHYMMKPIQRIPQYRLLFNDYLKNLKEDSSDYEDTLNALRIVTNVVEYVNNRMKLGDKVSSMVNLQSMLGDYTLIKPGRELVKHGPLEKLCRKTLKERYFILLNDCLIYSSSSMMSLKVHHTLPLGGMKVAYNEDDFHIYTFKVFSTTKSFILCAKSETERKEWVEALQNTIDDYIARQNSFTNCQAPVQPENFQIGKVAPIWISDSKVTMCQICSAQFTQLFRRHHCRACGKVICWKCGDYEAPLQFERYKGRRVCEGCFNILLNEYEGNEDKTKLSLGIDGDDEVLQNVFMKVKSKFVRSTYMEKEIRNVPNRLREVTAKDAGADISGWLRRWKLNRWKSDKEWYVLKDRVLYVYRASEDIVATKSISVLGYSVERGGDAEWDNMKPELVFQLTHPRQAAIVFSADCELIADRWFRHLTEASQMTLNSSVFH